MDRTKYAAAGLMVLIVLLILLMFKVSSLSVKIESREKSFTATIEALRDSLAKLQRDVDSLKRQAPGLGEHMSAIQLHVSKLWFAAKASSWDLASFELDELNEGIDAAEALHVFKNNVDITNVLQSLQNTQLQSVKRAIEGKRQRSFRTAYGQTLDMCNGCHRTTKYAYIHIIIPTAPPVMNQRWNRWRNVNPGDS